MSIQLYCKTKINMADNKQIERLEIIHKNPDFAVICSFLNKFEEYLPLPEVSIDNLERWITDDRPSKLYHKASNDFLIIRLISKPTFKTLLKQHFFMLSLQCSRQFDTLLQPTRCAVCGGFKDFLLALLKKWKSSVNEERFARYLVRVLS